ncbi:hypothetical protein T492DRAFT_336901 [Pavlovales sp. CCMP2436]|nr:hypothetical protein T492DRAFT_336901 [Pavlovales sp. CCMP2436]
MAVVDAELGFLPWLCSASPETYASAADAALRDIGLGQGVREELLSELAEFSKIQSGERKELRERSTDMTEPHEWYPQARLMTRKIVMHVGPTNSGKTHSAMVALKKAKSGIYCGPLRLLAWEVFDRLNADGLPCALITGQERVNTDGARHAAVTVEMASISTRYDLAVLDEIQMLGHEQRGWAWTRALLGIQADEIHTCGDETACNLVQKLCYLTGDELVVHHYKRLSPLAIADRPLTGIRDVRPGDALIAFSRREIYRLKAAVEKETGEAL